MDILFSSAFLLLVLFLITQFVDNKHYKKLVNLAFFGIFVGVVAILYVSFFKSSIKIISPIEIQTENTTATNLKVYAITFGKDPNDSISREVVYDKELKPSSTSNFSINKVGLGKFWIVAKNTANEIKYLKVFDDTKNNIDLKISDNEAVNKSDAQTARELIFALDINKQVLNFAIWSNILLIILLIWSIIKLTKGRK